MTALALRDDQDYWDERQLAVLHQTGIGQDVTKPELAAFLHECQQRKLDPFTRQIYLIGRYDKRAGRAVYRSQTGIDGFRLIARRAADKAGETIEYEDTLWCAGDGEWTDVWLAAEPPAACKVVVLRNGKRYPVTVRHAAYVQTDRDGNALGLWQKMPDNQIEKCAEAKALRKAFPEELGGIYTDDEMAQADNPQRVQATAEVIREEPAVRVVRSEPAAAVTDQAWLDDALAKAPVLPDIPACQALWRESAAKVRAGEVAKEDATRVQQILAARMADLRSAPAATAALDPEDPWAAKVDSLASPEEAGGALAEVAGLLEATLIDQARADHVSAAILARFPQAADETRAAA